MKIFIFEMINYASNYIWQASHASEKRKLWEVSSELWVTKHKFLERKFRRRNSRTTCYGYSTSVWLAVARERKTRQTELKLLSRPDRSMTCSFGSIVIHCRERRKTDIRLATYNCTSNTQNFNRCGLVLFEIVNRIYFEWNVDFTIFLSSVYKQII